LDGKGFFTVRRMEANGPMYYYTRDGKFTVNNEGFLVNSAGDVVMGRDVETNELKEIKVNNEKVALNDSNEVIIGGKRAYRMEIVDFEKYDSLKKVGDNLYSGENSQPASNVRVKQRFLEKSNVNVVNEMVNMMTVMRTFESNQKVIQSLDETLAKAVNEVGTVR
jgi:Flagellar basal body rod protein